MLRKILIFFLLFMPGIIALACLNEHHVDKLGRENVDYFTLGSVRIMKSHDKVEINKRLSELSAQVLRNANDTLNNQNDVAVNNIKLGRLDDAEKILDALLKKYPNDYSVIVNLGTLYELRGNNQKALEFIKRAMKINPDSHNGSEWFHVKVLQHKIKEIPDNKISQTDILQLRTRAEAADEISFQVMYQLRERIPFTPAPNLVMAKILQEYGDFLADSVSIKGAYVIYEIGMDYDRDNILQLEEKRNALKPYFKKYKVAIPRTQNYYLDNIIATVQREIEENPADLLERGFNYLKKLDSDAREKEKKKRTNSLLLILTACVLIGAVIWYGARKDHRKETAPRDSKV